ncbi:helix-turn-helix DNA binding domain protein [Arthrobacter phage Odyssey395]|nr:helix-turn-helix DNA binding domain protein [Arthrobacter phage Odyssey395]
MRNALDERGIELTWDDILAAEAGIRNSLAFEAAVMNEAHRYHNDGCTILNAIFSHENVAAVVERTGLSLQTVNEVARELRRG